MEQLPKISKQDALFQLWKRGLLNYKLDPFQTELLAHIKSTDQKINVILCSRRLGKCLAKGTEIMTPTGPVEIQNLKVGDFVYGYNKDGSVSQTKVLDVIYNGIKPVYDLTTHNKKLLSCTKEHIWLTKATYTNELKERQLKNFYQGIKIVKEYVDIPHGNIYEPHAYAIGALLGDGCSKQSVEGKSRQIYISSENELIPFKVREILKAPSAYKNSLSNYTWCISNTLVSNKSINKVHCNYYDQWIANRYAHEKIIDLDVVKTWNRESCLALLAGLIDTDGSVGIASGELSLNIQISMQSKSVIETIQYLLWSLFQYRCNIIIDKIDKYKNGPCYLLSIKNNLIGKRILKQLDDHLVTPRKKWNPEYEFLPERNTISGSVGVTISKEARLEDVYDIEVDNETHLYLTAGGLVTHNSFAATIMSLMQCLSVPNSIVKFLSPTKIQVNTNLRPEMRRILADCPEELQPVFNKSQMTYYFKNGSELQLAGSDSGHADKLRGGFAHLCIVDEAQDCSDLMNVVRSVLIPTTMNTKGKIILIGTPPKDFEHDFIDFIDEALIKGTLVKKTIYDNPRITQEEIDGIIAPYPKGVNDPEFKREFLCETARDPALSVISEFTTDIEKEIIKEWPKPPHYDTYEAMDLGFKDMTVVLFAYYDFRGAKLVIEDEIVLQGNDVQIPKLIEQINKKEEELWTNVYINEVKRPMVRVSDINYIVTEEISRISGGKIYFVPARKDDKDAAINNLRVMIETKKIIINPRCTTLINHLRGAKWSKKKGAREFARSAGDNSHYDALDALIYLTRHVEYNKNPYPRNFGLNLNENNGFYTPSYYTKPANNQIEVYQKLFNIKKRN